MNSEIVEKLGIEREAGYFYYLAGSDVWRAEIVSAGGPSGKGPSLVARGRWVPERGYHYMLDRKGNIVRFPRTRSKQPPPKWRPVGERARWEEEVAASITAMQQKWLEIAARGGFEAESAATEALAGCREAAQVLRGNLAKIGYRWAKLVDSDGFVGQKIPRIMELFFREVGGIAFIALGTYDHVTFWEQRGVEAEFSDGLFIYPCEHGRLLIDDGDLVLAPDGYHKDNISGGRRVSWLRSTSGSRT
jgi:hypothetical protein